MANQPQLVMQTGPNPGKVFELENADITVGRDIANDIVINDAEVSRKHARLFAQGDQFILEDLGSTNGTFVNGQRIAGPHTLASGDTIQMGENVTVVYEAATFDPDATAVMSSREPAAPPEPEPEPEPMFASEPEPEPEPEPPVPEPEPMPAVDFDSTMADEPPLPPPPVVEEPVYTPPVEEPVYEPPPMELERESTFTGPPLTSDDEFAAPEEPPKKNNRTAIFAGCGCLLIFFCLVSTWALWTYGDQLIASLGF